MTVVCKPCEEKGYRFIKYHEGYDAYYCGICDTWLEKACSDPECCYCPDRPERPSQCKT